MKPKLTVWSVSAVSESGDNYGPFLFEKKPTEKQLREAVRNCDGELDGSGPGSFGTYVHLGEPEQIGVF